MSNEGMLDGLVELEKKIEQEYRLHKERVGVLASYALGLSGGSDTTPFYLKRKVDMIARAVQEIHAILKIIDGSLYVRNEHEGVKDEKASEGTSEG